MPLKSIHKECRDRMDKSFKYLEAEFRGLRTGRASTALIDYLKVDYYGSPTELRELAAVSVPEPTQLVVKPFDPGAVSEIIRTIETADLGLNPMADGQTIRISVPSPSGERRKQLIAQVKKLAEDARVAVRNERRDAIKQIDQLVKDKENSVSEDQGKSSQKDIDEATKKHIAEIDALAKNKTAEIEAN